MMRSQLPSACRWVTWTQHRSDRLAVLQVSPPQLSGRLVLAWRASGPPNPAGRALVSHLRDALASR